jgi:FemAB-related protein (PEP-CTERM system-associated)
VEQIFEEVHDGANRMVWGYDHRWFLALSGGLRHEPYLLVATRGDQPVGVLPLALVKSLLFGRFLVSLPYVSSGGLVAAESAAAKLLIDRAVQLADELKVRHLELRHETPVEHPALNNTLSSKVIMRLDLPDSVEQMRNALRSKVRNKVRKGEKQDFTLHWGHHDLLGDFYSVFCRNMRDLGTPVFGRKLFDSILTRFSEDAELCVVRSGRHPIAGALLVHYSWATEVPSASSLKTHGSTNVNDLMYWHLLRRAVERGQGAFDFGRSTKDSSTFVFKKKWGAQPCPVAWQYYIRNGNVGDMRIESGRYNRLIATWQKLPVWMTRVIGPPIIRGIP